MKPLDDALNSRNSHMQSWARALISGDKKSRLRAAQNIRNSDEAEQAALLLDPSIYASILKDAPTRDRRGWSKSSGMGPSIDLQIDRGLTPE